ncbi:MAG: dihydroorotate dehydrogenase electron transfer subunit [Clostridiales bacterium]|nr:dihydroorotate dehydrogenase electron transfer subunit [Clostridiales bacterium]
MNKYKEHAVILKHEKIASDVYSMWIETKNITKEVVPGQFLSLFCQDSSRLLPRPISVCETLKENHSLRLVYKILGKGTEEFSQLKAGDQIEVMGPFGNGFELLHKKALIIGGGVGIPPMLELAKNLHCEKQIVLGFRDELFLKEDLEKYGEVFVSTEDGNYGTKGNVLDAIRENGLSAEVIYSCGPTPMLRAIKNYALENNIIAQLSLEERMACGIGACLACTCKTKEKDHHSNVNNKRICKDGPVFYAEEVEI